MNRLSSCPQCQSFNPLGEKTCLNCDHILDEVRPNSLLRRTVKAVGVVALSMTLTACYGAPIEDAPCDDIDEDGVCDYQDCNSNDPQIGLCPPAGETSGEVAGEMLNNQEP